MSSNQLNAAAQAHWEIAKLLEMGVNNYLIARLSRHEIRELLKTLVYLKEKHAEYDKSNGSILGQSSPVSQ